MRQLTVVFLLLIPCALISQTDKEVLKKYSSVQDWQTDSINKFINKYYTEKPDSFFSDLIKNLNTPNYWTTNCKVGISLLKVVFKNKQVSVLFDNKFDFGIEDSIRVAFLKTQDEWRMGIDSTLVLKISIGYVLNSLEDSNDIKQKSFIEMVSYSTPSPGNQCNCRNNLELKQLMFSSVQYSDLESAYLYAKDLCRRFPFNKEYHNKLDQYWEEIEEERQDN